MAIVINEFEAVAEAPPRPARARESSADVRDAAEPVEAEDVGPVLHLLAYRALRLWAH